jgi:hypothetical protein
MKHEATQTDEMEGENYHLTGIDNNAKEIKLQSDLWESQRQQLQTENVMHNQRNSIDLDKYYEMQMRLDDGCR